MLQAIVVRALARRVLPTTLAIRSAPLASRAISTYDALLFPAAKKTTTAKGRPPTVKKTTKATKTKSASPDKSTRAKPKAAPKKRTRITSKAASSKTKATTRKTKPAAQKQPLKEYTPPPKRPATPFFLYLADHRPAKTNATEILAFTRERAKKWHELSQTERQSYSDRHAVLVDQYKKEYDSWKANLSPTGWRQYRAARAKRIDRRSMKDVETGDKINRVPSGFNLWVKEKVLQAKAQGSPIKAREVFRSAGHEWSSLSDSEKAVYNAKHAELMPEYLAAREKVKAQRIATYRALHPDVQF